MKLIHTFSLNRYCTYKVLKRSKKNLSVFPAKLVASYQDYSVDFLSRLDDGEKILSGFVIMHGQGLRVESVYKQDTVLTAFISGGLANHSYYITYTVKTNLGNNITQEMILPTFGYVFQDRNVDRYITIAPNIRPPNIRPPLNGIKLMDRYLLDDNGFFICS